MDGGGRDLAEPLAHRDRRRHVDENTQVVKRAEAPGLGSVSTAAPLSPSMGAGYLGTPSARFLKAGRNLRILVKNLAPIGMMAIDPMEPG